MVDGNSIDVNWGGEHNAKLTLRSGKGPAMAIVDVIVESSDGWASREDAIAGEVSNNPAR